MRFAAIDFETANHRSDSPCQVAVVVVEDGTTVAERSWLIRPKSLYFSEKCIAVHGIRPRDVLDAPEWDSVWNELGPMIEGEILLAHHAPFDMAVLASTLELYDLAAPPLEFQCTRLIARRTWPGRSGYGLKQTAASLDFEFKHHDALEDSRACAQIAIAASSFVRVETIDELETQLGLKRGLIRDGNRTPPRCVNLKKAKLARDILPESKLAPISRPYHFKNRTQSPDKRIAALRESCGDCKPLAGKKVVVTGQLFGIEGGQAADFIRFLGATVQTSVDRETDFLILGATPAPDLASSPFATEDSSQGDEEQTVQEESVTYRSSPTLRECYSKDSTENSPAQVRTTSTQTPVRILTQRQLLSLIPNGVATDSVSLGISGKRR